MARKKSTRKAKIDQYLNIELDFKIPKTVTIDLNRIFTDDVLDFIESQLFDENGYQATFKECKLDNARIIKMGRSKEAWTVYVDVVVKGVEVEVYVPEYIEELDAYVSEYIEFNEDDDIYGKVSILPDELALLELLRDTQPYGQYILDLRLGIASFFPDLDPINWKR